MTAIATNTGTVYDRIDTSNVLADARWIGRCKKCGARHKVEGRLTLGHAPGRHDYVIATGDGAVFTMAGHGSDTAQVVVRCADHWCSLRRVIEGRKKSKHACGARCTNASGPNCDCRCRGRMHGSGL